MPYNLQDIATKARPWRALEPTQALQSDLYATGYRPIIQAWERASANLMPAYAAALASGSVDELAAEEQSHAAEIAAILLLIQWQAYFTRLETWHRSRWLSSVSSAAGVDVSVLLERPTGIPAATNRATRRATASGLRAAARETVRVQRGALAALPTLQGIDAVLGNAVAANASLVRSVSDQARARIANAVFNGVAAQTPVEEVAREISNGLALSKKRALRVAKDQTSKAVKALNRFRIEEAGFKSGTWEHLAGQLHPRLHHQARDKKVYRLDDPIWGELMLPNCHCQVGPPPLLLVRGRGNVA